MKCFDFDAKFICLCVSCILELIGKRFFFNDNR